MKKTIINKKITQKIINRLAHEIIEVTSDIENVVFVGIVSSGIPVAQNIAAAIKRFENISIPVGKLDASLYRDDLQIKKEQVTLKGSDIPFNIEDKTVILVDSVLYTGRTIRASLDALCDFGRPKAIKLAVLIDRGNRELPIEANFVGKKVTAAPSDMIITDFSDDENTVVIKPNN